MTKDIEYTANHRERVKFPNGKNSGLLKKRTFTKKPTEKTQDSMDKEIAITTNVADRDTQLNVMASCMASMIVTLGLDVTPTPEVVAALTMFSNIQAELAK